MKLIDGKEVAKTIKAEIAGMVEAALQKGIRRPCMGAIIVGHDGGSEAYISNLGKTCDKVGVDFHLVRLEDTVSETELIDEVNKLNDNTLIDGYIIQFPLPKHIDSQKIIESINPAKDMDGMHPFNVGRMTIGLESNKPATPSSVIELIRRYEIPTSGKHAVIIGRSNVIGKPVSTMLMQKGYPGDCTITVCHSRTKDIKKLCREADILIAALGSPGFVTEDMVKEGAVVLDVGTTMVKDDSKKSGWSLKGDVDFEAVAEKTDFITPVPGGVGPVTVCCLLQNLMRAWSKNNGQ